MWINILQWDADEPRKRPKVLRGKRKNVIPSETRNLSFEILRALPSE